MKSSQHFNQPHCLHLQDQADEGTKIVWNVSRHSLNKYHIPGDLNYQQHCCDNSKCCSHILVGRGACSSLWIRWHLLHSPVTIASPKITPLPDLRISHECELWINIISIRAVQVFMLNSTLMLMKGWTDTHKNANKH
jgi:hypothetical protein